MSVVSKDELISLVLATDTNSIIPIGLLKDYKNIMRYTNTISLMLATLLLTLNSALAADLENGKKVFEKQCASCHGKTGMGDGPVAAGLPASMKPRNLQEGGYKVVKDVASLKELLKKGGAAYGLNALMAAQPSLSEKELDDVSAYALSLKK